jgi:hypothetical protein
VNIAIELKGARGESVGVPKLVLDFRAKNVWEYGLGIVSVKAEIRAAPSMIELSPTKCPFLGYGELEQQVVQLPKGAEQNWTIGLPLLPYALRVIEETRKGHDLFLMIQFFCTAAQMDNNTSPLTSLAHAAVHAESTSNLYCRFKVAQSDWEKTIKELGAPQLLDAEALIKLASQGAQETLREIQNVAAKAKEAASITGVAQHSSYFKDEAGDHRRASSKWLVCTAVLALAAIGYSLWSFRFAAIYGAEGSGLWWPHMAYVTSRLVVLSVIFFGMGWSARNYRAQRHNEVVNRHRQNALRTFETFAVAATDPATRDAVLLAATKSIFEAQSSGYLTGEPEKVPSGTVIEILRSAISKGEPS